MEVDRNHPQPTINPITISENKKPNLPITISEAGILTLGSGEKFSIQNLTINGKVISENGKFNLNLEQQNAIKNLVSEAFARLETDALKTKDISQITIRSKSEKTAELEVEHKNTESIEPSKSLRQSPPEEKVGLLFEEVKKAFNDPSKMPTKPVGKLQLEATDTKSNLTANFSIPEEFPALPALPQNKVTLITNTALGHFPDPVDALASDDPVSLTQVSPTNPIKYSYKVGEKTYGTQTVTRQDTLTDEKKFLLAQLRFLEKEAKDIPKDDNEALKAYKNKVDFYTRQYTNILNFEVTNNKKAWLDTNYFRDLIREKKFFGAIKEYICAPINMRYQELEYPKPEPEIDKPSTEKTQPNSIDAPLPSEPQEKVGFVRVGVMSDMTNGWFSLADLKKMKEDSAKIKAKFEEIEKKRDSTPTLMQKIKGYIRGEQVERFNENQRTSMNYALSTLDTAYNATENNLSEDEINKEIDLLIEERKMKLQQKMICLIQEQVVKNPHKFQKGQPFEMIHVGLLNQKSVNLDETGWMHDERVEMEDMHEIFNEFDTKKIIFDEEGPYIDKDGNPHLPPPSKDLNREEFDLKTYFFNFSVQGNTDNDGIQKDINEEGMKKFYKNQSVNVTSQASFMVNTVKAKRSGYEKAENFIHSLLKNKEIVISVGCLSAKDRTGFLAERLMHLYLPKAVKQIYSKKIFDSDAVPIKVVQESAENQRIIKVNPLFLPKKEYHIGKKISHLFYLTFNKSPD